MEQEVLLKDVLPYIWVWTVAIACILSVFAYRIWRFGKKYPEIFKPDTTSEDKQLRIQKAELRRQYNNKSMVSISIIFVWMIGIVVICLRIESKAPTSQGWFILSLAVLGILLILTSFIRKPKK